MINLTESASSKVKELMSNREDLIALRVGVRGGGCSGFTYFLEFANKVVV
jgi:Fe-S cluster assembly iron-binding protein IscA